MAPKKRIPKGSIKNPKTVTLKKLQRIAGGKSAARVGVTTNLKQRAQQYKMEGYRGKMFQSRTRNMRKAEDKLLQKTPGKHNIQKRSNAPAKPGRVYTLKGRKYYK